MSLPAAGERPQLLRLLADLETAVEELLLTGLAAASDASRQTLAVSFEAASRMRLLRLGFTLRVATEELGRFARNDAGFSRRRFGFFLNRAWLLSRGMREALEGGDEERWGRLNVQPTLQPVEEMDVVSLGVGKRVVPSTFVAFEFRLRTLGAAGTLPERAPLVWSAIFPLRQGTDVPAEAFLHLPQAQGFKAAAFLPGRVVNIKKAQISGDGRINLGKDSKVETRDKPFTAWDDVLAWDPASALARVRAARPSPFDLDVELQEEVVLRNFTVGEPESLERERLLRHPLVVDGETWSVVTGTGPEDAVLREHLAVWKKKQRGPLYGLLHYEACRFMFQPLTLHGGKEPEAVQLGQAPFDAASLVKALKFT